MKVAVGCDHAGLSLKKEIMGLLSEMGVKAQDFGCSDTWPVDYPDVARPVAEVVAAGEFDRGILICGTGIGMSMVANKFPNVRAALCNDLFSAKMSRLHNDANVLVLGGRIIGRDLAAEIVRTWLDTAFEGDRHMRRLQKIKDIEDTVNSNGK